MAWNRGNYGSQRGGAGGNYGGNQKQSYPNSGALFPNDKKSEKAPDVTGNITLSEDVLEYILNHANDGEVKLDLSGWDRQAQSGIGFISLKVQTPYADRQQQGYGSPGRSRFQPRPQGDRDERAQYGRPQQNISGYAQQSQPYRGDGNYAGNPNPQGGRMRTAPTQQIDPRYGPPLSEEDFQQGDRMPDFMRDD